MQAGPVRPDDDPRTIPVRQYENGLPAFCDCRQAVLFSPGTVARGGVPFFLLPLHEAAAITHSLASGLWVRPSSSTLFQGRSIHTRPLA